MTHSHWFSFPLFGTRDFVQEEEKGGELTIGKKIGNVKEKVGGKERDSLSLADRGDGGRIHGVECMSMPVRVSGEFTFP